jgi:polyhydroxyalkanoate synthesis regulator phasin
VEDIYLDTSRDFAEAERLLDEFFENYDPDLFVVDDATVFLERISKLCRKCDAAKMLTARRLEKAHAHTSAGFKNPETWLSSITGEPVGQAASKLQTARQVEAHPVIKEAVKKGKISEPQAKQIASAADRCPDQARDLVDEAPLLTFGELKRRCDDVRSASDSAKDEIERYERIRKSRYCRTWTDGDGAGHLEAKMTPDALGIITAAIGNFEKGVFEDARKSGVRESHQAYMMDALVAMARGSVSGFSSGSAGNSQPGAEESGNGESGNGESGDDHNSRQTDDPRALLRLTVDLEAFLRGHATDGETCKIPGYGPVPVALARKLLGEALLELVIKRGTDVTTVVSDSRYVRKALRIALEERDPTCVVPNCDRSDPLERDHWQVDFGKDGPTSLDNLARLCSWHHDQKTHRGWVLEGGPGQWKFYKPDPADADAADVVGAGTAGAAPGSEVTDTAGAREARRRAAPANDPPVQPPLL